MSDQNDNHNHDEELEEEVILLTDEDGKDHEYIVADVLEFEDKRYAVLIPRNEEGDAAIFRLEESNDDEDVLVDIEDDEEWTRVVAAYEQLIEEDEDESDD